MNLRPLLIVAIAAGAAMASAPAKAVVSLSLTNPSTPIQQTLNNPCVIGGPSCNNPATFPFTLIGNQPSGTFSSPTYTVGQLSAFSSSFDIGIDVSTTPGNPPTESLSSFIVSINGVTQFEFSAAAPGTTIIDNNPGNGFSDAILSTVDLSSFASNATVVFSATLNNRTDGPDSFFLITQGSTNVPEPMTLAMVGTGLIGLGVLTRRRQK